MRQIDAAEGIVQRFIFEAFFTSGYHGQSQPFL